jgi:hypothetical protein
VDMLIGVGHYMDLIGHRSSPRRLNPAPEFWFEGPSVHELA